MFKSYRKLKNLYKLNELLGNGGLKGHSPLELGLKHDLIDDAQRLHASVYLGRGFVSPEDIDKSGKLHIKADSHQEHSYYFAISVEDRNKNEIVATVRHIEAIPEVGIDSFPLVNKVSFYDWFENELKDIKPENIIEISGLAKRRGAPSAAVLLLYREMWYRSLRDGHSIWLMACDTNLYLRLQKLFEKAIVQIGDQARYQGGDVIPALCRPYEVIPSLLDTVSKSRLQKRVFRKKILEFLLMDYPTHLLTDKERRLLKQMRVKYFD